MAVAVVMATLAACGSRGEYRSVEGGVWNTVYHITYCGDRDLSDSIVTVMKRVEMSLSPFNDSSIVSRVNRGENPRVDSLFIKVMEGSRLVNRLSGGAFDPTVAPVVNLWGFGYRNSGVEPDQAMIDSVLKSVGIADCSIDSEGYVVRKTSATEFNFSAITKGFGCDEVGAMFRRNGVTDYMVEIGGEIALAGNSPRGAMWRIMVDAPIESDTAVVHDRMAVIAPEGFGGVATSGNYRNYRETASEGRIGHTVSPVTGRPVKSRMLSATIVAGSAMMADALATACMAMEPQAALEMIGRIEGAEALLVTGVDSSGQWIIVKSKGFPALL